MATIAEKVYKQEKRVSKILGSYKGNYTIDEATELVTLKTRFDGELNNEQILKLINIGEVLIKRSGSGLSITIKYYL